MTSNTSNAGLRAQIIKQAGQLQETRTQMMNLQLQIEDRNWTRIGNDRTGVNGLSIRSIQTVSDDLRPWIVAGGILKRIVELRGTYIYGDGFGLKGSTEAGTAAILDENNVAKLFSVPALLEINRAHGTDGNVVFLVHKRTKEIIRVPFDELGEPYVGGRDRERIWYIRHTFTDYTAEHPEGVQRDVFYVATTCPAEGASASSVKLGAGEPIQIDPDYTAILWKVNGQVGWPLGVPDLFPALQWGEKYTGYLKNQDRFAEALAQIAWQYKVEKSDQAKRVAAVVSDAPRPAGGSNVSAGALEATPMAGASGVNFDNGSALAGQAAAAGEVPLEALLGKSMATAGGNLDPDFVRVILARRESVRVFIKGIGKLLGAPDLEPIFYDLEQESPFREAQMMIAANGTGLFNADEIRKPLADKLRLELKDGSKEPEGYLVPNNEKSLEATAKAKASGTPEVEEEPGSNNGQGNDELGVGKTSDEDNTARDKGEV